MALMRVIDNLGESREEGSLDREQGTGLGVAYPGVTFGRAFLGQRTPPHVVQMYMRFGAGGLTL